MAIPVVDCAEVSELIGQEITPALCETLTELAGTIITNCYGDSLDQDLVNQLALFLVAHFASGVYGNIKTERIGPTYVSYDSVSLQDVTGNPLSGTRWGQAVIALDPSGCIANGHKMRATLRSFTEYTI